MRKREYFCLIPLPFIITLLLQVLVYSMTTMLQLNRFVQDETTCTALIRAIVGCINLLVFGIWYYRTFGRTRTTSLKKVLSWIHVLTLIVIAVCGQIAISFLLILILPLFEGAATQYQSMIGSLFEVSPITLLYVMILAPMGEECIFRGMTFHIAKKAVLAIWANLIQAVLFGLYHGNLVQGIYAFVMGFVFGIVVIRLDSLWTAIIMHIVLNGAGLWMNAYVDTMPSNLIGSLICILSIAIVVISIYLLPSGRKSEERN